MKLSLFSLVRTSLIIAGSILSGNIATAQVTPDNSSINTQVNQNGNTAEITGGQTQGDNLFHSFQDFSVPTGNEASFNNANNISNIFGRVTGGNISNIDGLIRANGTANLFLINPAGIIFGNNARLDIGGSFLGSTSSSILFEDGEFSANLANPPLLTINAPIGLGFRDNPGEIVNRSVASNNDGSIGLAVTPGNNLALVGGNINFESGSATARSGNIELGGLSATGIVEIDPDGSLSFPEAVARADISLSNAANVDVTGAGGGNITINARNLNLEPGEFGGSNITGGIISVPTSTEGGDITINAAETVNINSSNIANTVLPQALGNSGKITITTDSLNLTNGGEVNASTIGEGNAGLVSVTASDTITIDGENPNGNPSAILSQVAPQATGNSGGINIATSNLTLTNGGEVNSSTVGQGNAGSIEITANDITIDGERSGANSSSIFNGVASGIGNSEGINIATDNLTITNGARINASTIGQGNAGMVNITANNNITIDGERSDSNSSAIASAVATGASGNSGGITIAADSLSLFNGGEVNASTAGIGNAGTINIAAMDLITVDGERSTSETSSILSAIAPEALGNSGGINITTSNLSLKDGGTVNASTLGQGNAGLIDVTAKNTITIDGEGSTRDASAFLSVVVPGASGDSEGINITTSNLVLTNGGAVNASTVGQGNAGLINVTANDTITIDGERSSGDASAILSIVTPTASGNSGGINITTSNLTLTNEGEISASTFGAGNAGQLTVQADSLNLDNNAGINASTQSGLGGIINLQIAEGITLDNNSNITARAFGEADGGNLTIDTNFIVAFADGNSDIIADAQQGDGGNITINTRSLFGIKERPLNPTTNDINASSKFSLDGNVRVNTPDVNPVQGVTELPANLISPPEQTTAEACRNRTTAGNTLNITGKGGIGATPDLPLDSHNIINNDNTIDTAAIPQPIETSQGKIQPARGIKITESGEVILTAYATNNSGERIFDARVNCRANG